MASDMADTICAVVLNWKDTARTVRCVRALLAAKQITQILVVDNESSGELSIEIAEMEVGNTKKIVIIELAENRGFAAGVNRALERALADGWECILVINNDATIDASSVRLLQEAMRDDPGVGLVAPRILNADGSEESAGGFLNPWTGTTSHTARRGRKFDFITWACVVARADAVRDVGLLSEEFFMYWEDVDISLRLLAAGWGLSICTDATVVHEVSANRSTYPIAIKAYHTWSGLVFARKHRGTWLFGRVAWLVTSAAANALRLRGSALRGLRTGVELDLERSVPAYRSPLRKRHFGS